MNVVSLNVVCTFVGKGNGNPLQYSCLENPMDRGAWKAAVHGVAKSQAWLSIFTFTFHFHALGKEMATHSSILAWRIPGTEEPRGLPSVGSHRVGHDWSDLAAAAAAYLCNVYCFPVAQVVKNLPANGGDSGLIPGLERSPGEGCPLQYSCLENPMDRRTWQAPVHGASEELDRTQWLKQQEDHP